MLESRCDSDKYRKCWNNMSRIYNSQEACVCMAEHYDLFIQAVNACIFGRVPTDQ